MTAERTCAARPRTPLVVTTDLDRTLLFSPSATRELGGALPRSVVEVHEGRVISEMADVVRDGLAALSRLPAAAVTLVPTTTRTVAQLRRIALPFLPRFAIANSGGVVLAHGQVDRHWARSTTRRLAQCAPAAEVRAVFDVLVAEGSALRAHTAGAQFCYAVVDPERFTTEYLEQLVTALRRRSWRVAHQGRKVYALPDALHKAHAVDYVRERLAEELGAQPLLLAAGDTWLDSEMLELADQGWVPMRSELHEGGFRAPHVAVTDRAGHAAAAQIVEDWTDRLDVSASRRSGPGAAPRGDLLVT